MQNILHELYHGNISPWEREVPKEEEYRKTADQLVAIESILISKFDDADKELYRQLTSALIALASFDYASIYADGFRTGANIMLACLSQEDT